MNTQKFIDILNRELIVALGCTEPIAIAYAAALARKYVKGDKALAIKVFASPNIIKNAMSVNIPGAEGCGINLAASLGALAKNVGQKLEVLSGLTAEDIENAKKMVGEGHVIVNVSNSPKKLYIEVIIETEKSNAKVVIEDGHTNVVLIEVDSKKIKNSEVNKTVLKEIVNDNNFLNLDTIWEFIENIDLKEVEIIRESIKLNTEISKEGMDNKFGLEVGRTIKSNIEKGLLSDDILNYAMCITAAGSDARMAGCCRPVMSNSGSGNQGILATLPVVAIAEKLKIAEEKLIRGVLLSNLITIYIKSKFGVLSALCGATIAATGASCGITYIMGGELKETKSAIQNMLGNVTGILCDGAKLGCALKVATCVSAAVQSALLAIEGITIKSTDGIIEDNPEKTIENLCKLGNQGTLEVDKIILDIMLNKIIC